AMDTETTSLDPMVARLVGMSFATAGGVACYVPVAHRGPDVVQQLPRELVIERLRAWLESADSPKRLHNAKYGAHVMASGGVRLAGITEDTRLQAYVLESPRRVNLQELGERWRGRTGVLYEDICGKGAKQIGFDEVDLENASRYACEDADFTSQLHHILRPRIAAEPGLEGLFLPHSQCSDVLIRGSA